MSFTVIGNVVFAIFVASLIIVVPNADSARPNEQHFRSRWMVHVVNEMETRGELFLHCKSRDDDLGIQHLGYKHEFVWTFKENFWITTMFWCYFRSSHGHAAFEVFWTERKSTWLEFRCGSANQCIWTARDDGIHLKDNSLGFEDYKHGWNSTSEEHGLFSK